MRHRRSLRLKTYDYATPGAYFVTIVVQGRMCLFGDIVEGAMRLNDAGRMVEYWLGEFSEHFPNVSLDVSVVMPNHVHFVVVIVDPYANVASGRCWRLQIHHHQRLCARRCGT